MTLKSVVREYSTPTGTESYRIRIPVDRFAEEMLADAETLKKIGRKYQSLITVEP